MTPKSAKVGLGFWGIWCKQVTRNASSQHVYLHDGILVQLFAVLELLAFALLG